MRIEIYKGIIFVNGSIPNDKKIGILNVELTNSNNQANIDKLIKDKIIENIPEGCNAICNYQIGKKQGVLKHEDRIFYGQGDAIVLSQVSYAEYIQYIGCEINELGIIEKRFKHISTITNTAFDFQQEVLILKQALYRYEDIYLVQMKLFYNGILPMQAIKIKITAYNSFQERYPTEEMFVMNHLYIQENTIFGDMNPYALKLPDVSTIDIEVVKTCDIEGNVYDCQLGKLTQINNQRDFFDLYTQDIQDTLTHGVKFKDKKLSYVPDFGDAYWRCACGKMNKERFQTCECGIQKEDCKLLLDVRSTTELCSQIKEKYRLPY